MTDQGNGAAPKETVTVAPLLERFEAIVMNDDDDVGRNPSRVEPLSAIIVDRMRRRT